VAIRQLITIASIVELKRFELSKWVVLHVIAVNVHHSAC
jgi:hypothetical protein